MVEVVPFSFPEFGIGNGVHSLRRNSEIVKFQSALLFTRGIVKILEFVDLKKKFFQY